MANAKVSRRLFLVSTAGSLAAAGVVAAGCSSKPKEFTCTDEAGLSPADKTMRSTTKYVDKTPEPAKKCDGCLQYKAAAPGQCGGCNVIKGPIHPEGYCTLWAKKA